MDYGKGMGHTGIVEKGSWNHASHPQLKYQRRRKLKVSEVCLPKRQTKPLKDI
jgi:hypothetical protein